MIFEEQFPSLNDNYFYNIVLDERVYTQYVIEKFCLDKQKAITKEEHNRIMKEYEQKVREAIEKFRNSCFYLNNGVYYPSFNEDCLQYQEKLSELFKELGLNG